MKDGARKPSGATDFLRSLERAMEREPHLRVGQLLINAIPLGRDPFYVEDDELRAYLDNFPTKEED